MEELCICGDSYGDVLSKNLFTDISGLFFYNSLPIMLTVFLNDKFIGNVPDSSKTFLNNGFNIEDKIKFFTITGQYLGSYILKDKFIRRIHIGKRC